MAFRDYDVRLSTADEEPDIPTTWIEGVECCENCAHPLDSDKGCQVCFGMTAGTPSEVKRHRNGTVCLDPRTCSEETS